MTDVPPGYGSAWKIREATGDTSASVLDAALRAETEDPLWLDADSELRVWIFDCWERGVSPLR